MKKAILSVILLAAGLLFGCSSEETVSKPETIGQTGTLTFSFPSPRQSVTYAIGDATGPETAVTAKPSEIEINDATVYMFKNSGNPDEELLVARKTASQSEVAGRSVTFDVEDFATGFDNYVFYAVANVNNNFEDSFLVGYSTLSDFTSAVAIGTGTAPVQGSNMLMVGYVTINNLSTTTASVQTINLRHRVARFDIDNLTADEYPDNDNLESGAQGDIPAETFNPAETFFEITKIHVINTLSEGYLTAEDNTLNRPVLDNKVSLKGADAIDVSEIPGINEAPVEGAFYLWPGKLADKDHLTSGSTVIEVEGVYTGDGKAELFTVLLETEKPIEANMRYTLKVKRISQTTLTFKLEASGWGDGNGVTAGSSTSGAFVYDGFELIGASLVDDSIDLTDETEDSELRFYTGGDVKATGTLTATLDLTVGAAYASEVTLEAVGDPVVTYSIGKVRQYYKITLPRPSIEVSGTLTIDDGKSNTKTFNIYFNPAPLYSDTGLRAILVGGKYWSPVNVGATSTTYSADLAGCGYVYQWGRSYIGFAPGSGSDTQGGPVTAAQASGTYAAKFITVSGTPFDWLSPQDDLLWSGDNSRGPCPAGWRVPTDVELTVLNSKYNIANIEGAPSSIRLKIPRDSEQSFGDDLYLPAVGFRTNSTGAWANQGTNGYYWSSTVPGTSARAFNFHASSSSIAANPRGYGISVRCIQE